MKVIRDMVKHIEEYVTENKAETSVEQLELEWSRLVDSYSRTARGPAKHAVAFKVSLSLLSFFPLLFSSFSFLFFLFFPLFSRSFFGLFSSSFYLFFPLSQLFLSFPFFFLPYIINIFNIIND